MKIVLRDSNNTEFSINYIELYKFYKLLSEVDSISIKYDDYVEKEFFGEPYQVLLDNKYTKIRDLVNTVDPFIYMNKKLYNLGLELLLFLSRERSNTYNDAEKVNEVLKDSYTKLEELYKVKFSNKLCFYIDLFGSVNSYFRVEDLKVEFLFD